MCMSIVLCLSVSYLCTFRILYRFLVFYIFLFIFFFFKQKTAYEMRISDWSSDVCSSDLNIGLTTDTTLLQTVVGSSVSIAIRNFLLLIGGTVLLEIGRASCRERVCQYV